MPITLTEAEPLVPQAFDAVTETEPLPNEELNATLTDTVPCPLLMEAPAGTLQLYDVAPATAAME